MKSPKAPKAPWTTEELIEMGAKRTARQLAADDAAYAAIDLLLEEAPPTVPMGPFPKGFGPAWAYAPRVLPPFAR